MNNLILKNVQNILVFFIEECGTNKDVNRQLRKIYGKANMLLKNFRYCSTEVKCRLFQSFCTSMYGSDLWFRCHKYALKKIQIAYNNSLRRFMKLPKHCSASEMFVNLDILSFGELMRKSVFGFIERLESCNFNVFIVTLMQSHYQYESTIWTWWKSLVCVTRLPV